MCVDVRASNEKVPGADRVAVMNLISNASDILKILWSVTQLHHPVERSLANRVHVTT